MKLVAFTNTGKQTVHVGSKSVNPGETREVDARFVPTPAAVNSLLMVLFFNTADQPRYFGEKVVEPGEHERLPANHFVDPNTPADTLQTDLFRDFLDQSVKFISSRLVPFTDEELVVLERMETEGGDKRSTLLSAIENERAVRVAEQDFQADNYSEHLQTLTDEDLDVELLAVADDTDKLPLVQEELANRKDSKQAE